MSSIHRARAPRPFGHNIPTAREINHREWKNSISTMAISGVDHDIGLFDSI